MNIPAILNIFKVIREPSLCLPHYTVSNFGQLPIPLSKAFMNGSATGQEVQIKAIVLDKDNCFAKPGENIVHKPYVEKFRALVNEYQPSNILIVSNSAGMTSIDSTGLEADILEQNTGVKVLRHSVKKPACTKEILNHFHGTISSPSQIAVIGDRLFTDIVMANDIGARSIWIRDGAVPDRGLVTRIEHGLSGFLIARGFRPPSR